ncbi:solute carrier family 25 member 35 isoform X1 [Bactrocera oleae]|uniref:solute carrier family 25 member 35 isoform X1 n=1 Tax=Bactrocera oleae TaxID=104688 RepID=UPI001748B7AB|nr:solute carrier family 25 member 35-like isoform X1 [Bactrocera oleae]
MSDFIIGGLASVGTILFTNPLEVIKTRLQLQGELAVSGTYNVRYRGIVHAFVTVIKNDGWTGLQKGLVPAMYFQFTINSIRLGMYNAAVNKQWTHTKDGGESFGLGLFWGAAGGAVGAYFASPFLMIKTQLQSQAAKNVAVGYQHHHTGMFNAIKQIYLNGGLAALWRGSIASIPRASIGSGAQIATFGKTKSLLREYNLVVQPTLNSMCAGFLAGCVVTLAITPPDVISTRLYNQGLDPYGKGLLYSGWWDCFFKIARSEGLYGLYKGFWASYLRFAPHSTLLLVFFDELLALKNKYQMQHKTVNKD